MNVAQGPLIHFRSIFGSGLAANLFGLGFSALGTLATARILGASGRGEVAVLTVVSSYLVVAFSLSLESGILHFGGRAKVVDQLLRQMKLLLVILTLGSITSLSIFGFVYADTLMSAWIVVLYGIGYGVPVAVAPLTAIERLRGRHHSAMWWPSIILAAQQVSGLGSLVVHASVSAYIVSSAIGGLSATLTFLFLARPGNERVPRAHEASRVSLRRLLAYSIFGHWGVLLHLLCMRLPILLAGLFLGNQAAGVYSVAAAMAELALLVTQSQLGWVLAMATKDPHDFAPLRQQLALSALLTTALVGILILLSRWVPAFVGMEFLGITPVLVALAPGVVCLGMWRLASYDLAARGQARLRTHSAAWGALVGIGCGLVAVQWGGLQILAWSATVTYVVMFASLLLGLGRRLR